MTVAIEARIVEGVLSINSTENPAVVISRNSTDKHVAEINREKKMAQERLRHMRPFGRHA